MSMSALHVCVIDVFRFTSQSTLPRPETFAVNVAELVTGG